MMTDPIADLLTRIRNSLRNRADSVTCPGSKLKDAFIYKWRLWSIPEVRELLAEAGFSRSEVYWEGEDDVFRKRETAASDPCWICYIVGVK